MLTNTNNLMLYGICNRALQTLVWSEPTIKFNIILMESSHSSQEQGFFYSVDGADITTITPKEEFNYNKFLNYGIDELKRTNNLTNWILILNNDLIFTKNWLSKLLDWQKIHPEVLSLNPWEPQWHERHGLSPTIEVHYGYRVPFEITGWCILINKEVISKCDLFDPRFVFWYQDNDYAKTLESHKIKHALLTNSKVYHMASQSHEILDDTQREIKTHSQINTFVAKWGTI